MPVFGTHCDTVGCKGLPVARVRRKFAIKRSDGRIEEKEVDKEVCGAPGCLEHQVDLMYEPQTVGTGTIEFINQDREK